MKKIIGYLLSMLAVLVLLPILAVKLVHSDASMAICFILFYLVDPIFFAVTGAIAGGDVKRRWYYPLASVAVFLASAWLIFTMDEGAFVIYSVVYFVISAAVMLIQGLMLARKPKPTAGCRYCKNATQKDGIYICKRRGEVSPADSCGAYKFDPFAPREEVKRNLDTSIFDPLDFEI